MVPLGVPESSRGLGLGIAALVHGFARAFGQGVALAQLHGKPAEEGGVPRPVESLIPAGAWRDLATRGQAPGDVEVVITGHFEPPGEGVGLLQVVVFDAKTGALVARGEAHVDGAGAGAAVVSAFEQAWAPLQGDLGGLRELADLSWEALESVLKAERCALFDPIRGGPHDSLAALAHLGRVVELGARRPSGSVHASHSSSSTSATRATSRIWPSGRCPPTPAREPPRSEKRCRPSCPEC